MPWMAGAAEEIRVYRLLQDFDAEIAEDYLRSVNGMFRKESKNGLFSWIPDASKAFPIGYRIKLGELPVHLLASHPISRFAKPHTYNIWRSEREFCATLGIIPVYFAEFGVYTVLKLWNEGARRFFESEEELPTDRNVCWAFMPEGGGCEFSGMNFLLKSHSRETEPAEGTTDLVNQYFTNGFWSFPRGGFSSSAHLLHSQLSVRTVIKVSKSIFSIEGLEAGIIEKDPDDVPVTKARMWRLDFEGETPVMKPILAVLATDIAETISEQYRNTDFFVNGVVSEFRRRMVKFHALTSVAVYGISSIELVESVIALVAMRNFERLGRPTFIGTEDELRKKTDAILKVLHQKVRYMRTIGDSLPDQFDSALKWSTPLLNTDGHRVYYYHPCLMSALSAVGVSPEIDSDRAALLCVLKLADVSAEKGSPTHLRSLPESDVLASEGYDLEAIIGCIPKAKQYIELSRAFHGHDLY